MEPATPDELEHIIRELMHNEGPPLLVANDSGRSWVAGRRVPPEGWRRAAETGRERSEQEREQFEQERRQVKETQLQGLRGIVEDEKLAGDVFHPDNPRYTRHEAIREALKEYRDIQRKARADEAIRKAVKGDS